MLTSQITGPGKSCGEQNSKKMACFGWIAVRKAYLTQDSLQNEDLIYAAGVSYAKKMLKQQDRYGCSIVI